MKRLAEQTLYEILEVPPDAAAAAIADAYERARALYGPGSLATYTLMTVEEAALLTSRIEEAKQTLLDADARARYDAALAAPAGAARPGGAGENGAAHAPFGGVPPVIPALVAPAPEALPAAPGPADLLQGTADAVPPPPAPIRLEREVRETPPPAQEPPAMVAAATPPPVVSTLAPAAAAEPAIPMPDGALWSGEALRRVREARGLTVQQIAERTKVARHHVENIEAERFSALPASVYLRGSLLSIARELRLDGQKVARAYLERVAAATPGQGGAATT